MKETKEISPNWFGLVSSSVLTGAWDMDVGVDVGVNVGVNIGVDVGVSISIFYVKAVAVFISVFSVKGVSVSVVTGQ